ncbi:MAG: hypothetical protein HC784_07875 [Hydrococcus sp. CSU_1_8]|nr:hypothetical protein [Hydrococcus sp. CSU_1_8]
MPIKPKNFSIDVPFKRGDRGASGSLSPGQKFDPLRSSRQGTEGHSNLPLPRNPLRRIPRQEYVFVAPTTPDQGRTTSVAVAPQLPPLSTPDEYLPNTPMKFTGYIGPLQER